MPTIPTRSLDTLRALLASTEWEGPVRDLRLDFLRGYCVVAMVVDHTAGPSILYLLTGGNNLYSSAAEGFVFISGLLMGIVYRRLVERNGLGPGLWRALERAVTLYLVTVTLSLVFIPISELLHLPRSLELDLRDPAALIVSILTLHRTYYLVDVPLLYALLLLIAPLGLVLLAQGRTALLLLGSWLLWGAYQIFPAQAELPWHITDNTVFAFSPWQVFFFTGLALGWHKLAVERWLAHFPRRPGFVVFGVALWGLIALSIYEQQLRYQLWASGGSDQARQMPLFILDAVFGKPDVRPGRILASIIVFGFFFILVADLWRQLNRALGWFLIPLGQHALYAYIVHVLFMIPVGILSNALTEPGYWDGRVSLLVQILVLATIWALINLGAFTKAPTPTWVRAALPAGAAAICLAILALEPTRALPQQASAQPFPTPGTPNSQHGAIRELPFFSPALDREMPYVVYLPPNYEVERRHYPVLFLLPGDSGSSKDWIGHGLAATADQMITSREVQPMIIVMPEDEAASQEQSVDIAAQLVQYVSQDLVRHVDATYRVRSTVPHRAIGGMATGGTRALTLAFSNPGVFPIVGAHLPSLADESLADPNAPVESASDLIALAQDATGVANLSIWMDLNQDSESLAKGTALHDALSNRGVHQQWQVYPTSSATDYWASHIPDYLRFYDSAFRQPA